MLKKTFGRKKCRVVGVSDSAVGSVACLFVLFFYLSF